MGIKSFIGSLYLVEVIKLCYQQKRHIDLYNNNRIYSATSRRESERERESKRERVREGEKEYLRLFACMHILKNQQQEHL